MSKIKSRTHYAVQIVSALLGVVALCPFVYAMYRALLCGELPGGAGFSEESKQGLVLSLSIITAGFLLCAILALRRLRVQTDTEMNNPPSFSSAVALVLIGAGLAAVTIGSRELSPGEENASGETHSRTGLQDLAEASRP
jgi:hypothetical protein